MKPVRKLELLHTNDTFACEPRGNVEFDSSVAGIMVADEQARLLYVNQEAEALLACHEAQIREVIPRFDARSSRGMNVQSLLGLQPDTLTQLTSARVVHRALGATLFRVAVSPVLDTAEQPRGIVLEWSDPAEEDYLRYTTLLTEQMSRELRQHVRNTHRAELAMVLAREQVMSQGRIIEDVVAVATRSFCQVGYVLRDIGNIVAVLDKVAASSKLLALSTAAEATHAGEENRQLVAAATDIAALGALSANTALLAKQLVDGLMCTAQDASDSMLRYQRAWGEIVASVEAVSSILADQVAGAGEQSADVREVRRTLAERRPRDSLF